MYVGPDRLTMTFSPRFGAELISWSIDSPIIATSEWQGRPYYYVMLVRGEITGDHNITLNFRVSIYIVFEFVLKYLSMMMCVICR